MVLYSGVLIDKLILFGDVYYQSPNLQIITTDSEIFCFAFGPKRCSVDFCQFLYSLTFIFIRKYWYHDAWGNSYPPKTDTS